MDRIRPAVEPLLTRMDSADDSQLLTLAVRANIRAAAAQLRRGSALLERLVAQDGLVIVGAEYRLETGVVDFLDETGGLMAEAAGR